MNSKTNKLKYMYKFYLPIKKIGEKDWVGKLTDFLEEYDIEPEPLEDKELIKETEERFCWKIPEDMKMFYLKFGATESDDFLYNLKPLEEFSELSDLEWEYVTEYLDKDWISNYIVFAESLSNDPIAINKETNEIYLFSHDPLIYAKIYNDFNDYILANLIDLQELLGDLEFNSEEDKLNFMSEMFSGDNIDYQFRNQKL